MSEEGQLPLQSEAPAPGLVKAADARQVQWRRRGGAVLADGLGGGEAVRCPDGCKETAVLCPVTQAMNPFCLVTPTTCGHLHPASQGRENVSHPLEVFLGLAQK